MGDLYTVVLGLLILLPLLGNIFFPYFWLDLSFLFTLIRIGYRWQKRIQKNPPITMLDIFLEKVQKHPEKPLILFEEEVYSYRDIDRWSSQVARVLQSHVGMKEGETVAVFLKNAPVYVWVWIGVEKIGCTMACINYNIRSKSLLHALSSCEAKVLLTTPDFQAAIEDVLPTLNTEGVRVFYLSDDSPTAGVEALLGRIKSSSAEPVPTSFRAHVTSKSTSLYIFTSGTTGLPKAAIITHRKALQAINLFWLCGVHANDIIYIPLPLYHGAGLTGIASCIDTGATCVLTPKFSVTKYWDDCRQYHVTVVQYIGEIMRYVCNAPKKDNDCEHSVRIAVGNGMRVEVWKEFLNRFGAIRFYEMYGATEGNAGFINYTGKVGAVGRTNFFHKKLMKFELIQYDIEKDEPVRDKKGCCIPVAIGDTGLLVIKITENAPFEGYAGDLQKTEKKILRDVLKKGDCYFNSGDLLMQDHEGFIYFQDRVGDTFRWKGENVATTEVETTLAGVGFIQEINVYGVPVSGHEGKIGMGAMRLKEGFPFDGKKLYVHAKDYLPNYAIPRFIRIREALEITGTFKQHKGQLVKEGFDPAIISDPLYFLDDSEKCYVPMTQEIFNSIVEKKLKL
ncbi:very long-chain acyl-CoA synthetase-like [Sceloporus undulatus]|uniref:very long-chain acyl-CoA synthetase-like n=1 Tax=Sceloporus undulatus TaxID=8520 RepID=UPI001C4D336A|nr:very long-chain acyl-CoA synthetase-like [Sceloporus undulatus]XP_042330645.1 very long-chain acyl-CoA synthetase-like [Sceloporus undulatus]